MPIRISRMEGVYEPYGIGWRRWIVEKRIVFGIEVHREEWWEAKKEWVYHSGGWHQVISTADKNDSIESIVDPIPSGDTLPRKEPETKADTVQLHLDL